MPDTVAVQLQLQLDRRRLDTLRRLAADYDSENPSDSFNVYAWLDQAGPLLRFLADQLPAEESSSV